MYRAFYNGCRLEILIGKTIDEVNCIFLKEIGNSFFRYSPAGVNFALKKIQIFRYKVTKTIIVILETITLDL